MKIEEIRQLAEIMQTYGLERVELEDGATQVRLSRGGREAATTAAAPLPAAMPELTAQESAPQETPAGRVVVSPMVGVFYSAPAPGAEPYIAAGKRVNTGDTLCIVEAMKMMNEIAAEQSGEVAAVHVKDGDIVEVGQPLLTLI